VDDLSAVSAGCFNNGTLDQNRRERLAVGYGIRQLQHIQLRDIEEATMVLIKSNPKRSRESRILVRRDFIIDCAALLAGGLVLPACQCKRCRRRQHQLRRS
jgi:hypothetical protein